jgi:hypothetical protein
MTAVDFLLRQFALLGYDVHKYETIINEAKEMEKQKIIGAYDHHRCIGNFENGEEYYNQTSNQQEQ